MSQPDTMGAYLRAVRRKRRVSIERAAEGTRIRADYLMRMESDEFDFMAPAYVRGFIRSYARFLGVDPDPLLVEFDRRYGSPATDTSQIVALERRARSVPRDRRPLNSWAAAAVMALAVLVLLAIVGLASGPEDAEPPRREVAENEASPDSGETPSPAFSPSASPTPSDEGSDGETFAFKEGISLKVVAATADCWIDVTADGSQTPLFSGTITVGEDTGRLFAEEKMNIVLGNAPGVELIVNGRNIGTPAPSDSGDVVVNITLPDDIETLL